MIRLISFIKYPLILKKHIQTSSTEESIREIYQEQYRYILNSVFNNSRLVPFSHLFQIYHQRGNLLALFLFVPREEFFKAIIKYNPKWKQEITNLYNRLEQTDELVDFIILKIAHNDFVWTEEIQEIYTRFMNMPLSASVNLFDFIFWYDFNDLKKFNDFNKLCRISNWPIYLLMLESDQCDEFLTSFSKDNIWMSHFENSKISFNNFISQAKTVLKEKESYFILNPEITNLWWAVYLGVFGLLHGVYISEKTLKIISPVLFNRLYYSYKGLPMNHIQFNSFIQRYIFC